MKLVPLLSQCFRDNVFKSRYRIAHFVHENVQLLGVVIEPKPQHEHHDDELPQKKNRYRCYVPGNPNRSAGMEQAIEQSEYGEKCKHICGEGS